MSDQQGSTPDPTLFPIFLVTLLSLVLLPLTIWQCTKRDEVSEGTALRRLHRGYGPEKRLKTIHYILIVGWTIVTLLVLYLNMVEFTNEYFDPFEILGVSSNAEMADIKRQYRQLSLRYHPDKNPEPAAQAYFRDKISKAYQALTDEVARENYKKYGHPDGRQGIKVAVALPSFVFGEGKAAPFVLGALVLIGILLPMGVVLFYLRRTGKYTKNNIQVGTLYNYMHMLKPAMGVTRMIEVFVLAMEVVQMPVKGEQKGPMAELEKIVRAEISKEKEDKLLKLRTSIVKAYMLLTAHMCRSTDEVSAKLLPDLHFLLQLAPRLIDEMVKLTLRPRWLAPTMAALEFSQCLVQAVSPSILKPVGKNAKSIEATLPLLQLPHVDAEVVKRLGRRKVRSMSDLFQLGSEGREEILMLCGLAKEEAEDVESAMSTYPNIEVEVRCRTAGEKTVVEGDLVTCTVYVRLQRGSPGFVASLPEQERFKSARKLRRQVSVSACTPRYPFVKPEKWWIMLADPRVNSVFIGLPTSLIEAEARAFEYPSVTMGGKPIKKMKKKKKKKEEKDEGDEDEDEDDLTTKAMEEEEEEEEEEEVESSIHAANGEEEEEEEEHWEGWQAVELKLQSPRQGTYEWCIHIMSDSWLGVDKVVKVKLNVLKLTPETARSTAVLPADALQPDSDLESGDDVSGDEEGDADDSADYSEESGSEEESDEEEEGGGGDDDDDDMPELLPAVKKSQ